MRQKIKIKNRIISQDQPVFISAEIGVTCNYEMKLTKELIDVVHEAGADAVKLIFWFPEEIMSDKKTTYTYQTIKGSVTENMYEMLDKLRFSLDEWKQLKKYAEKRKVILFSTVNSPGGIKYAEEIGLEAYKLSSWDWNYFPLWEKIAALGKPLIVDTGPVNADEVHKVLKLVKDSGNDQVILVHCTHSDKPSSINMKSIAYMRRTFNTLVGYSSKGRESETDFLAVGLGAVYLEKRLTMSRKLPGHHHILSLEPEEFKNYVKSIREAQTSLGVEDLVPSKEDLTERKKFFRHLVVNQNISRGAILTKEMLEGKRPERGVSPEQIDYFVGRKTKRDLKYNEALTLGVV